MKVETKWFGTIEIGEDKIINFEKGLIGLEKYKKFTIIFDSEKDSDQPIMWLQSLDDASLALPIMKPEIVMDNYDPIVEDELIYGLGKDVEHAELLVVVTLTVPSDLKKMSCNLKAPIIINIDTLNAVQLIADNDDYLVRYPIYDILNNNEKGGE